MVRAIIFTIGFVLTLSPMQASAQIQPEQVQDHDSEEWDEQFRLLMAAHKSKSEGDFAKAAELGEQLFKLEKGGLGEQDPRLITSLTWLAKIYEQQGAWEKAIERQNLALGYSKQIHGGTDWRTVDTRLALVALKQRSKMTQSDREALERANEFSRQCVDEYRSGNFESAIKAGNKGVEIEKKVLGEEHPLYARMLGNLAAMYQAMGDYARAEPLYLQCKEIDKKVLGEEHLDYA